VISVSGSDRGYPKVDLRRGIDPSCLFCLSAFAAQECQGEVEPFNFAPPAFGDCAFTREADPFRVRRGEAAFPD